MLRLQKVKFQKNFYLIHRDPPMKAKVLMKLNKDSKFNINITSLI